MSLFLFKFKVARLFYMMCLFLVVAETGTYQVVWKCAPELLIWTPESKTL